MTAPTTKATTTTKGKPTCANGKPPPCPRPSRNKPCKGSYNGIEYDGSCKLDCEATGMVETYWHSCSTNGYKCCIGKPLIHCNITGTPYKSGKRFSKNCMMFECYNGTLTSEFKYNIECAQCKARNDPHCTNFDKVLFDWHGQTDALMVQTQPGTVECPDHFVGMAFRSCTPNTAESFATCLNTVFYKTYYGIEITVPRFVHKIEPVVIIEGNEQTLEDQEISILKGANGTEVPVIGFKKDDCLHILGIEDEGLLVVVCQGQLIIYAYPSLKTHLAGLCGTWTGDSKAAKDYYELRNGTQITRPNYADDRSLPTVVGLDWEMPDCLINSRRRRDAGTPVVSDEKPCNATDSDLKTFYDTCAPPILATGNDNATKTEFINDCVFDQCIAISRANNPELAAGFFNETASMVVQAEAAANDTVQYPPGQPGTPNVTEIGPDFVVLVWSEPEDAADANILEYIIERRDLEGGNWTQCGEVNGNLTQVTITDVEEGNEYIFQVIAVSEAGESEPSESSEPVSFASPYVPTTEASTTDEESTSTTVEEEWMSTTEEEVLTTTAEEEVWTSTTVEDIWISTTDEKF